MNIRRNLELQIVLGTSPFFPSSSSSSSASSSSSLPSGLGSADPSSSSSSPSSSNPSQVFPAPWIPRLVAAKIVFGHVLADPLSSKVSWRICAQRCRILRVCAPARSRLRMPPLSPVRRAPDRVDRRGIGDEARGSTISVKCESVQNGLAAILSYFLSMPVAMAFLLDVVRRRTSLPDLTGGRCVCFGTGRSPWIFSS